MALLAYALTTVARQKSFLGISSASYDTLLENLINAATDCLEHYCDRRFKVQTISNEVYDGDNTKKLVLRQWPVDTGESFTLQERSSIDNENDWDTIDSGDYFVKATAGIIEYVNGVFSEVPQHFRISYTAGYDYDNAASFLSDVGAADLEYACWKLVGKIFNDRKTGSNIQSESLGDYSVSFIRTMMLDPEVKQIADKYRRAPRH